MGMKLIICCNNTFGQGSSEFLHIGGMPNISFRPILRTDFFKIDGKKNGEEKT
jgi:hypothetical protein